jgi:hypothetical protein
MQEPLTERFATHNSIELKVVFGSFLHNKGYEELKARAVHRAGTEEQSCSLLKHVTFLVFVGAITHPKSYKIEKDSVLDT